MRSRATWIKRDTVKNSRLVATQACDATSTVSVRRAKTARQWTGRRRDGENVKLVDGVEGRMAAGSERNPQVTRKIAFYRPEDVV